MDNSMKLAEQIFEIENADWRQQKEWRQKGVESWALVDTFAQHISLRTSEDYLCWQLWKNTPNQARSFVKIVPKLHLSKESIKTILEAQPWTSI